MVRAITSEKRTSGAFQLLLVPSQVSPFDQVQKIFFDSLYDDSLGPLTSITAHYQEEGISGLAFSYKSKKTDMIGYPTDDHQTIQVKEGSRIVRFSVTVSGNNVTELEVQFLISMSSTNHMTNPEPVPIRIWDRRFITGVVEK